MADCRESDPLEVRAYADELNARISHLKPYRPRIFGLPFEAQPGSESVLTALDVARRLDSDEFHVEINLIPVEIGGHHFVWSAVRSVNDREGIIAQVRAAVESALISLRGLISICAWCNRIRDERGLWQQLEKFIESHSDAKFTHAMCPDCLRKLDPVNHHVEKA
jgi:hypothetical protein